MKDIGWQMWPLFSMNGGLWSYCSLDYDQHLKGWDQSNPSLLSRLQSFVASKSNKLNVQISQAEDQDDGCSHDRIVLITHLTYFGYCFNPVSFYYIYQDATKDLPLDERDVSFIITEVSNTPWIEQHSYVLDESIPEVVIKRDPTKHIFDATWNKDFHVSPFMEMDYKYNFKFSRLGKSLSVGSKLIKLQSDEVWFTASFDLQRIDFTPWNLLYVLCCYPLQTRLIQVYIHIEALKLWWKGIPTFPHPKGAIIDFGLGITDRFLLSITERFFSYYSFAKSCFNNEKKKADKLHVS
jgi:uncharacterized protein